MEGLKYRASKIIKLLNKEYPSSRTALEFKTSHQMLVSTILSAQCTDKRVNEITKTLFKKYKSIKDFARADLKALEKDIFSTGFYKNKAKNIINSSRKIINDYDSNVPDDMQNLLKLPGVARKTANVVLGSAFSKVEGIVVDTHVKRLSTRLGLTSQKTPEKIEKDLMSIIPKSSWINISYGLISHGRKICTARKPKCNECLLSKLCPCVFSFGK